MCNDKSPLYQMQQTAQAQTRYQWNDTPVKNVPTFVPPCMYDSDETTEYANI